MSSRQNILIRDAREEDLPQVLQLLRGLTAAPDLTEEKLLTIFRRRRADGIVTKVAEDRTTSQVVGTASLLIEQKYIRGGLCVGHIEDVVTDPKYRGCGVGKALMEQLLLIAKHGQCYKVILNCSDKSLPYYEKLGFQKAENQMRIDLKSKL